MDSAAIDPNRDGKKAGKRTGKGAYLLLAAALLVIAGAIFIRNQASIYASVYARRLAAPDIAPDAAVALARELATLDPAEKAIGGASAAARARYRVVTGFEFRDVVGRFSRAAKVENELGKAVESAEARALALKLALARDVAEPDGRAAAEALLSGSKDVDVRKRAAGAVALAGPAGAAALRRAFADPSPEIATLAFESFRGLSWGGTASDVRVEGYADALGRPELRTRAIAALGAEGGKPAARVLVRAIEQGELGEASLLLAYQSLEKISGEKLGTDLAAWKAWVEAP